MPDLQQNRIPKEIQQLKKSQDFKKILFSFLIIQMKYEREEIAEVLIRIQSFVEYVLAYELSRRFNNLLIDRKGANFLNAKEYPEVETYLKSLSAKEGRPYRDSFLGLMKYIDILIFLDEDNPLIEEVKPIIEVRAMRNSVAHHLDEIPNWDSRKIKRAYEATTNIMHLVFDIEDSLLHFYDKINEELQSYLV